VARAYRWLHNVASQVTGLGITTNIIDCYGAILRMWEPGDRIYLFGFSRGAYTVRCLGAVLSLCGVPTRMPDGCRIRRDALQICRRTPRLTAWQLRDVRRTFRSSIPKLGVRREIAERLLNHISGKNRSELDEICDRYEYIAEKRQALERWEQHITDLLARQ
jgi:hypothetical protein